MYDLLELYARPYRKEEPVICVDEKSKQLLQQTRTPIAARPGAPPRRITNIGALARVTSSWQSSQRADIAKRR